MRKIFTGLSLLLCAFICFAALKQKDRLMLRELSRDELKGKVKKIMKELAAQEKSACATKISSLSSNFKIYCDHPFTEADTGWKKSWFLSIYTKMRAIVKIKSDQELVIGTRNAKAYRHLAIEYANAVSDLTKLLKNPVKIDKSRLKTLRREARLKRRALERKLNN